MSILDIFKLKKMRSQVEQLTHENEQLKSLLLPEHKELLDLRREIEITKTDADQLRFLFEKEHAEFNARRIIFQNDLDRLSGQVFEKSKQLIDIDEQILLQSFALYEPKFDFAHSSEYKEVLDGIREKQKLLIKESKACSGNMNWRVNNSASQGRKMVNDMIKLLLRSFNNECDICISNVKFNNFETYLKRIDTACSTINKLGSIMNIYITEPYKQLKISELHLAHEYQLKKNAEKEEQRQIREQMREEAKLQREIEDARKTIEKEKRHYSNALEKIMKQLATCDNDEDRAFITEKISELKFSLSEIERQIREIDYREANQRAGYVYIISNIGSFGTDTYKIGMTRRLEPYERVQELGDASVPFNFDVHAMIFSNDAPKLEATLHREFESKRINLVNKRREYFNVSLEEIEYVVRMNHDQTIEFFSTAAAEEFRESLLIRKKQAHELAENMYAYREVAAGIKK